MFLFLFSTFYYFIFYCFYYVSIYTIGGWVWKRSDGTHVSLKALWGSLAHGLGPRPPRCPSRMRCPGAALALPRGPHSSPSAALLPLSGTPSLLPASSAHLFIIQTTSCNVTSCKDFLKSPKIKSLSFFCTFMCPSQLTQCWLEYESYRYGSCAFLSTPRSRTTPCSH